MTYNLQIRQKVIQDIKSANSISWAGKIFLSTTKLPSNIPLRSSKFFLKSKFLVFS